MRLYVVFGDYTERLCRYLSSRYEIAGSDRTLEAAVAAVRSVSQPPDVFLVLGSALASGFVGGKIDHGAALVRNLKELRKSCSASRMVVVLSLSAGESLVQEIAKLGIYDVHRVEEVRVDDLIGFIDNPRTFADFDVDIGSAGSPGRVAFQEPERKRFWEALWPFSLRRPGRKRERLEEGARRPAGVPRLVAVAVGVSLPGVPEVNVVPPAAGVVLFSPERADPALLPPGAKGYIVGPGVSAWVKAALTGLPVIAPEAVSALVGPPGLPRASCTVVYSSSTAVGKTSIAFTLAALLAGENRACLVDIDSGKPTLTWLVTGRYETTGDLDAPLSTKWRFGFVPNVPETGVREAEEAVGRLLLRYDEVIVDCPGRLNLLPLMEAFLRAADRVLLVSDCTNRSVAAVRNFAVGGMRELGILEKTFLVVNKKEAKPFLKPKEVAERVGMPLHLELPHDPFVEQMFKERQPLTHLKAKKPPPFLSALKELLRKESSANVQPSVPADSPG